MSNVQPSVQSLTEPTDQSYTLPSRYYLDPAIYEREKEAILYRSWQYVGHVSQLVEPGSYITARIADENIFVIRGDHDELRGFYNVCRHRAHQLLEGAGNVRNIVCPYHAWSYARNGELRHARNSDHMPGFRKSDYCPVSFSVEIFCGFVFVNLSGDAQPLSLVAADLEQDIRSRVPYLDELSPASEKSVRPSLVEANWKVVIDNFLECYHCAHAHPDFANMIDMTCYQQEINGMWARQFAPVTRPSNSAYGFSVDAPVQSSVFWYLWPNTTLGMLPGHRNFFVSSVLPVSVGRTNRVGHRYGVGGEKVPEAFTQYINTVIAPEDIGLCESVQRRLRSRSYDRGRFVIDPAQAVVSEQVVQHFHRLVMDALG